MKTEIGGDRLGSGGKESVTLKTYSRSTHDMGYKWRSSMSAGTLVPFMTEIGLPGDNFDIDLFCECMTLPTIGPLFGSYKIQIDVFKCPIRLYNGKLHMNMLNIGMDMKQIKLPQIGIFTDWKDEMSSDPNSQINPSSIFAYLNIRGIGRYDIEDAVIGRMFNAVPYLAYWDIYKNYYANKMEERGFVVHNDMASDLDWIVQFADVKTINGTSADIVLNNTVINTTTGRVVLQIVMNNNPLIGEPDWENWDGLRINGNVVKVLETFEKITKGKTNSNNIEYTLTDYIGARKNETWVIDIINIPNVYSTTEEPPKLVEFPLENIDNMRMDILEDVKSATAFIINNTTYAPYGLPLDQGTQGRSQTSNQEGLGIKTYQSDLFNNWISTEWIDGTNGISEVTAVDTTGDSFTIDSLNLANKVYNMLNRIAISGGSYDDWLGAVYTHERAKSQENPSYMGSLIKELAFEEVISTADSNASGEEQPLGTLAGRGRLTQKNKGGKVKIKVDEPSYIMGIVSLTPRVDYSQGNKWDTGLKTLDDLHKPAMDEIGYQDLITDQMAWADTLIDADEITPIFKSAGKQPAWLNYMTNVNQVRGNFAVRDKEGFMILDRRYETGDNGIEDLTTYVDPTKFNQIFAQTDLSAQNFWMQIGVDMKVRRKISAKVIPNL